MIAKCLSTHSGRIHYWYYENLNPNTMCLVFTHGVTADHTMFDFQVEHLKKDYSVLTWDMPKHGHSRPYDIFTYEHNAQLLKLMLDQERIRKIVLVGMSNGGYSSQLFADQYPDYVHGMIAIDTRP